MALQETPLCSKLQCLVSFGLAVCWAHEVELDSTVRLTDPVFTALILQMRKPNFRLYSHSFIHLPFFLVPAMYQHLAKYWGYRDESSFPPLIEMLTTIPQETPFSERIRENEHLFLCMRLSSPKYLGWCIACSATSKTWHS